MKISLKSKTLDGLLGGLFAVICALTLGGIILALLGFSPFSAYYNLILGALSSTRAIGETLIKAIPLIFTALSFAIAKKCGLINLGAEGQLYMGALASTVVSTLPLNIPSFLHITLSILAGFLGGALLGALVAFLKIKFNASELITTIMFNYLAINFVSYMVSGPMKDPEKTQMPQSLPVVDTAKLPNILEGTRLHAGIFIAVLALIIYAVFLNKTTKGYELRVVGLNADCAKYAGINTNKNALLSMGLAGGFAGIGGAVEMTGIVHILRASFSQNTGFDGIAIALLGDLNAFGMAISSVFFSILKSGSAKMQMVDGVPSAAVYMIQGFIILFVAGREIFRYKRGKK